MLQDGPSAAVVYEQPASTYLTALARAKKDSVHGKFEELLDRLFVDQMASKPQILTSLGYFEPLGIRRHNRYLNDVSIEDAQREIELAKSYWAYLMAYPKENLSPDQEFTHRVISWQLQQTIESEKYIYHKYPITQMAGVLQNLTSLFTSLHPLQVPEDAENYIFRLGQIERQFKQTIKKMDDQKRMGIVPPRFAIAKSLTAIEQLLKNPIEKHPFYTRLSGQPETIRAQAKQAIERRVYPAYRMLRDYLEEYLKGAKREDGVWALPDGDAYYAFLLKQNTTLDISPEEIHEIGLKEVARIEQEIAAILKKEKLWDSQSTAGQHLQKLVKNPAYFYPNTNEGQRECLKRFEEIVQRARKELGTLFSIKPKSPVLVESVPKHEEEGSAAAYYMSPSVDGSRPGVFYVNLRDLNAIPKLRMETLAVHEAEPGHHFQRALEMESDTHITRKLIRNTAYWEGWALYVEKLAYEQGFYSTPLDRVGHLQDELLRAARLVIDTGIHRKRWSRAEAIDYMTRVTGMPEVEVVAEIERYFVMPGQACAYKIGQMKILALRQEEKERLGDKFDLKEFHSRILKPGTVPLSML